MSAITVLRAGARRASPRRPRARCAPLGAPIDVREDAALGMAEAHAIAAGALRRHDGELERRLVAGRERLEIERRPAAGEEPAALVEEENHGGQTLEPGRGHVGCAPRRRSTSSWPRRAEVSDSSSSGASAPRRGRRRRRARRPAEPARDGQRDNASRHQRSCGDDAHGDANIPPDVAGDAALGVVGCRPLDAGAAPGRRSAPSGGRAQLPRTVQRRRRRGGSSGRRRIEAGRQRGDTCLRAPALGPRQVPGYARPGRQPPPSETSVVMSSIAFTTGPFLSAQLELDGHLDQHVDRARRAGAPGRSATAERPASRADRGRGQGPAARGRHRPTRRDARRSRGRRRPRRSGGAPPRSSRASPRAAGSAARCRCPADTARRPCRRRRPRQSRRPSRRRCRAPVPVPAPPPSPRPGDGVTRRLLDDAGAGFGVGRAGSDGRADGSRLGLRLRRRLRLGVGAVAGAGGGHRAADAPRRLRVVPRGAGRGSRARRRPRRLPDPAWRGTPGAPASAIAADERVGDVRAAEEWSTQRHGQECGVHGRRGERAARGSRAACAAARLKSGGRRIEDRRSGVRRLSARSTRDGIVVRDEVAGARVRTRPLAISASMSARGDAAGARQLARAS